MLYIAENLKALRRGRGFTQEEVAEILNVATQSVSKWERGDTLPDITMLPAPANLYKVSVDALIGMDRISGRQARDAVFEAAHRHLRNGSIGEAVAVYTAARKTFPNDAGILSDLAAALALDGDADKRTQAVALCKQVLAEGGGEKVLHTTRAALCYIYMKGGEWDKAIETACRLPHVRESRETILACIGSRLGVEDVNAALCGIVIGEAAE